MTWMQPTKMIDLDDGKLAYYRTGTGPDLVLVHGWPLHSATFRHLVPLLAPHFTLHLFDLPGTGRTVWNGPVSFRQNVGALADGIDALGLESYALFGHDSGGAIARYIAADDPRVTSLVLEDTEIPGHSAPLLTLLLGMGKVPFAPTLFLSLMRFRSIRRSILGFGSCFTDPAYVDGEFAEHFLKPLRDERARAGQLDLLRTFEVGFIDGLAAVHARLTMPVLCVWGERDPYFPVDAARAMVRTLPARTTFATIPDARLLPHEDHPEQVARLVRSFLEEEITSRGSSRSSPSHQATSNYR